MTRLTHGVSALRAAWTARQLGTSSQIPRLASLSAIALLAAHAASAQVRPQIIRGRVTADSTTTPVVGANVVVTVAPTAEVLATHTDSTGAYRILIANATGEYVLNVNLIGWHPFKQRVNIAAGDSVATVNVRLAQVIQTLATTHVQATHPRPQRGDANNRNLAVDGANKIVDGVTNALSPDLQGNIDAMAALIPGLTPTAGGYSAFGLGPDANMKTLNGMQFTGDALPRDLNTTTSFSSSPWDPTRGGFSGALSSTTISSGGNIFTRRGRITLDAPPLQVTDPVAARFGQRFTNLQLGGSNSGAFALDRYYYDAGYQASVNRAPVSTLLDVDADALEHAAISPDSAFRLVQLLQAQHVPLTRGDIPDDRTTASGTFAARFDHSLPNPGPGATPPPQWNVITGGTYAKTYGQSLSPLSPPAVSGQTVRDNAYVQGLYSRYFGVYGAYVNETAANVSFNQNKGTPYFALPGGNVLIASSLADGTPTFGDISFGGNGALASDTRQTAFEINNRTNLLLRDKLSLPATIFFQSRYERYDQSIAANRFGNFNFASLNDLANNAPSSFTRTLNTPGRSGGEWMGAAAMGVTWNTQKFVLTGGPRLEANAFTGLPARNPAIERAFGLRNDLAPNSFALLPRIGFNWYYRSGPSLSINVSPMSRVYRGGPQIRGGFGEFRNNLRSDLLADAIGATGLPGSSARLVCTGSAAPIPDWQAFLDDPSSVPTTCAGGATTFADTVPNVTIVDRSYTPSRSWRSTLGWTNTILGNYFAIDGFYTLNLNQPSLVDVNFADTPKFTLANEGGRPVFVSPSSIVPSTGAASAVESRSDAAFGRVADRVSDLHGDARQVTVYLIPNLPFRFGFVTLGYTYLDARAQARGFDQSAALDPRGIESAPVAFSPRHQFSIQAARSFFSGRVALTTFTRVSSGLRFTPVVGGDVNGDGVGGDRAFIFDPKASFSQPAADQTQLQTALNDLIANGSSSARDCLLRQINQLAARNSCVGPWTATMNASLFGSRLPHMSDRVTVSLNLANPLGAIDQLLHGPSGLHGWGSTPLIDGTLYQVRGFDAQEKRYMYQVNPRFGDTRPSTTTFRTPFRLTLDVSMSLGPDQSEQDVILKMRIKPPLVGTRASADSIKNRYMGITGTNGFSDIYRLTLHYADSLALTRDQTERVQERETWLRTRADSVYGVLADYLAALPPDFSAKDAAQHVRDTGTAMWAIIYKERDFLKALLTSGQIRLLPGGLREMVLDPNFKGQFFYGF